MFNPRVIHSACGNTGLARERFSTVITIVIRILGMNFRIWDWDTVVYSPYFLEIEGKVSKLLR
jgi:hypothetical protein